MVKAPTQPILRWAGGKTRLLPELLARMPGEFGRLYEPFAGGAALFFGVMPARAVLGDINADLIATYRAVADDPAPIIRTLRRYQRVLSPAFYYRTRDRWNRSRHSWSSARRAATMIALNKSGFNGLWRVNSKGDLNVPMGRPSEGQASLTICEPAILKAAHSVLQNAELRTGDFRGTVADSERGDVVFFDPPYVPVSATAHFTSYTVGGFTLQDQHALAETARQLVDRGCHVMITNSDTAFVRGLYKGFKIDRVMVARSINSDVSGRGEVSELIIQGK